MGTALIAGQDLTNDFANFLGRSGTRSSTNHTGTAAANPETVTALSHQMALEYPELWKGDWDLTEPQHDLDGYESREDADFALCSHIACAAVQLGTPRESLPAIVDAVFRASGLMRKQWNRRRGEQTYGEITISLSLIDMENYRPDKSTSCFQAVSPPLRRVGAMSFSDLSYDLLKRIKAAIRNSDVSTVNFKKLFYGDASDYDNDRSKSDWHFVHHLAQHGLTPDECDMAMRVSRLMREKWDSPRGNSTYGADTIVDAFNSVEPVTGEVEALPLYSVSLDAPALRTATLPTENAPRLTLSDGLLTFSDDLPPPRDFVIQDLILAAKSALLAGLGGVSKSQLILQAAICVVLGLPFMGRTTKEGTALVLLGEEDTAEISRRVNAIAKVMQLTVDQLEQVRQRLRCFPLVGLDVRLTKPIAGALEGSGLAKEIIDAAKELETECGLPARLIALDHLGLVHGGDFNAREDAVQTMLYVNHIAQETGAAVVVLAHSPKASISKEAANAADVAGSAGFVDQSRGVYILRTMDDAEGKQYGIDPDHRKQYVSLSNVKANYTAHGEVIWMKREVVGGYEVSILRHVELEVPAKVTKGSDFKLRSAIYELIKERPCLTRNAIEGFSGKDGRLRASKQSVRTELDVMLAEGIVSFQQPTEEERKRMGIKGVTTGFLTTGSGKPNPTKNA